MDDDHATAELRAARPGPSSAAAALRRQQLAARLFGVSEDAPVRFGRFVLLERLGEGGIGTVHGAYDPQLDRRVALKLLRSARSVSTAARRRMLREAQALARLSHPNVVPVHDAGIIDDQVFIVMEYVVGATLREWVERERPSWAEILAVYVQAGRGLAAAHAGGIVHRDFKPDNAIRGADGRVRILDFGLARGLELERDEARAAADRQAITELDKTELDKTEPGPAISATMPRGLDQPLTATGAVMGTPAYMAPEQFLGLAAGPAADQFAFCASLYEALYGQRPFAGERLEELRANVLAANLREPGDARVPRRVFAALRRGLARRPEDRHPSIDALLVELTRDPRRMRRRALAIVAGLGLAVATGVIASEVGRSAEVEHCSGGEARIAEVWNAAERARLELALRSTGRAYADEVVPRVLAGLDAYAEGWLGQDREACEVHRRGELSDALFDARTICLARRLTALRSAVAILAETGEARSSEALARAVEVVDELPPLAGCADLEALAAEVPPPSDPAIAARVEALRERLIAAETLEHAGRYGHAIAEAEAILTEAEALDYRPLLAEALLVRGRALLQLDERREAAEPLRRAALEGVAAGVDTVALEALARHVYAIGTIGEDPRTLLDLGEALAARPGVAGSFAQALLHNNAGAVALAQGRHEQARAAFARALVIKDEHGLDAVELVNVLGNLALVTTDPERRRALAARAAAELSEALGPAHPLTLDARLVYSHALRERDAAIAEREEVCELYLRYHEDQRGSLGECLYSLALILDEAGERERAIARFEQVLARVSDRAELAMTAAIARAYLELLRGEAEAAAAGFEAILGDPILAEPHWWRGRDRARAQLGLARAQRALGREDQALASSTAAAATLDELAAATYDADIHRIRAELREQLHN